MLTLKEHVVTTVSPLRVLLLNPHKFLDFIIWLEASFSRILDSLYGLASLFWLCSHVFGYNYAKIGPIWMKSGALSVHCWGLALEDFSNDPLSSNSCRARWIFLSGKQCTISLISHWPISWTQHVEALKTFGTEFWNCYRKVTLCLVTSGVHNSALIIGHQKFTTKLSLYGMSGFYFYHWPVQSIQEIYSQIFSQTSDAGDVRKLSIHSYSIHS